MQKYIPESTTLNAGIVASVNLGNVVALDIGDLVHCTIPCKGNCEVVPERGRNRLNRITKKN